MGKKREKYLYRISLSLDDYKGPRTYGEKLRKDRILSKAIKRTNKDVKPKYKNKEVPFILMKEWR